MKKELIALLTLVTLLVGCEHTNKPTTPNKTTQKNSTTTIETSKTLNMKEVLNDFYNQWKGTKYKAGGNTKKGIDSAALTQRIYKDKFNITLPRKAHEQAKIGQEIKKENLEMGDIIIFKRKKEFYTGVYIGNNEFIHSSFKGVKLII